MRLDEKASFTALLALLAGTMIYLSLDLSPVAHLVPLTVLIPTLILTLAQLIVDLKTTTLTARQGSRRVDFFHSDIFRQKLQTQRASTKPAPLLQRELKAFGWMVALLLGIYLLGFALSLPLFILLYLRKRSGEGWRFSLTTSLAAAGVIYAVFSLILEGSLYTGFLWSWLAH